MTDHRDSPVTEIEPTRDRFGIGLATVLAIMGIMLTWAGAVVGWPLGLPFWAMAAAALFYAYWGMAASVPRQYRDEHGTPVTWLREDVR